MKKLVTGATGFMGPSIVRELLKDGENVKVLVRKTSDMRNIDGLDVEKALNWFIENGYIKKNKH
jgi:dihydroflavonol-4-reductase